EPTMADQRLIVASFPAIMLAGGKGSVTVARFLEVEMDEPSEEPARSAAHRLSVSNADTFTMEFDREATEDLRTLASELTSRGRPTDEDLSDAVFTALELLGLAIQSDLDVQSKYKRGRKKVRI